MHFTCYLCSCSMRNILGWWFKLFANFCRVNNFTKMDFKLAKGYQLTRVSLNCQTTVSGKSLFQHANYAIWNFNDRLVVPESNLSKTLRKSGTKAQLLRAHRVFKLKIQWHTLNKEWLRDSVVTSSLVQRCLIFVLIKCVEQCSEVLGWRENCFGYWIEAQSWGHFITVEVHIWKWFWKNILKVISVSDGGWAGEFSILSYDAIFLWFSKLLR